MTDDALALLAAILGELRGVRADMRDRRISRLAPADRVALMRLLPLLAEAASDTAFNVRELQEHSLLPDREALADAIAAVGGGNRLGRLLKRADGHDVAGYRLVSIGRDRDGLVWSVRRTCG